MAEQYIGIRQFTDKLLRHPLLNDLSLESIVDYTVDFMRIVGVPNMFEEKTEKIEISTYRGKLPCDYYKVIQVRYANAKGRFLRHTTDTFHLSEDKSVSSASKEYGSYLIQGNLIYTSTEKDAIEMSYLALKVDADGFPMLPDNSSFTRALELYIKKQRFTILFDMGKINQSVLQNTQQEYAWAVGDCQSEFNRLSIDEAESFYNSWRTLITRPSEHNDNFRNFGTKEKIKVQ